MSARDDLLVWMDLEMTGLDCVRCSIIEIATIITDSDLEIIAEGPEFVIHASQEELETLSDWSREHFTRSGLLDLVRASEVSREEAEEQTLAFLRAHTTPGTAPLCGNSIHHDRMFLYHHMPSLLEHLHYRIIDVSSLKELGRRWYGEALRPPAKRELHRASSDIHESLAELRAYRKAIFRERLERPDDA